jgi:glucose-1-phosphate thymidylyltransferase
LLDLLPQIEASPRGEYEIPDAIQALIDAGHHVVGVYAKERDQVSTPQDLLGLTRQLFAGGSEPMRIDPARAGRGTKLVKPLLVEHGVMLGDGCEVGPEVFLESGCTIGHGAVVRRSIVLRGARVGDGETIDGRVVT